MRTAAEPLLRVEDLRVRFPTEEGWLHALDGVGFEVRAGETLGIVGESGSGKTVAALTTMGLTRAQGAAISGRILLEGRDLLALGEREMRALRGEQVAMIFQDPLSSLHPLFRVGEQLAEAVRAHRRVSRRQALARAVALLEMAALPDPQRTARAYPHELSGGMRQRAMIAMALANEPKLLIADEPTTALDVTVQAQILDLLARLQRELGMAIVLITHDLAVVAEVAHEIAAMYAGRIVELAPARQIFSAPQHPYTWGLLQSMPTLARRRDDRLAPIAGVPASPVDPPTGCRFHPRCPYAKPEHALVQPQLEEVAGEPEHRVACLLAAEERRRIWSALRKSRTAAEVKV